MAHKIYDNFFLSNEVEDQFKSHLDLQKFCTVDNSLVGTPGMKRKINVYAATNGTEKLTMGQGNSKSIEVSFTQREYEILLAQNRFEYHDEEAMTDPMLVPTGMKHAGTDMFNTVNDDIYAEFAKATRVLPVTALDFAAFVDAQSMLNLENLDGVSIFAFVCPSDMAAIRKALKDDLKYVEAFAKSGYVGTVAGVNLYTKKDATAGDVYVATREAVTIFNKKGVEVEQVVANSRSETAANKRLNTIFSRKYYLAALTDETKDIYIALGKTATKTADTSVKGSTTYYAKDGVGYVKVTPVSGDNPSTKGWYTIA